MQKKLKSWRFLIILILLICFTACLFAAENKIPQCKGESLVDVEKLIPDAIMDIRYATEKNFLKTKLYENARCFLRKSVANKLKLAANELRQKGFRLVLWDCYRPLAIQKKMWQAHPVKGEVANPQTGSNHNRGAAVDVTLAYMNGKLVEMPSEFDEFNKKAWKDAKKGISKTAIKNREILKKAMFRQGFSGIKKEWWHFNSSECKKYPICETEF